MRVDKHDRNRLLVIALTLFGFLSLLIIQFYRIQIVEGEKWSKQAQKQQFLVINEPFVRGAFYSSTATKLRHPEMPQQLVVDVPRFHLYADPKAIPDEYHDVIANVLGASLSMSPTERQVLREQFDKNSRSRKLAMWLDKASHQEINSWWQSYARSHQIPRNALFFVKDYQRYYPFGKLLGQVLHTIQTIKDQRTQQAIPTGGLELYFNKHLQGKQGRRRLIRSPKNAFETGDVLSFPEHGADIHLTINHVLQAIAEEEVEKGVKKCNAKGGWAVMMDPRSGEILALAQYPFFHPSEYQTFFNDKELIEHTKVKAITDANEPGSFVKAVTISIALKANKELRERGEKELFTPDEKIATSNGRFPGRSKPITDTSMHPYLNMNMALWKSSNIYVARLVERIIARLGNEWYRKQLVETFGFGQKTHIELPAESGGVVPTPGKLHPNGALEWSVPTPFSMAFGHNLQASSLQLLRACAVFANGGYLVQPTLVRKIVKKDHLGVEHVILDNTLEERVQAFPVVLDSDIVEQVVNAMRYVTKPGGTATKADIPGYTEAGKTSTAKKILNGAYQEKLYVANFTGFAPVNNPAFVLVVTMDEPEYGYIPGVGKRHNGGNCTGEVFREIGKRTLEYLGIPPDDPYGYPYGDPRRNNDKTEWMAETKLLQEMYDKWNKQQPKVSSQ